MVGKKRMIEKERMDSLSKYARSEISALKSNAKGGFFVLSVLIVCLGLIGSCIHNEASDNTSIDFTVLLIAISCIVPACVIAYFLGKSGYNKDKGTIIHNDRADRKKAERIRGAFAPLIEKEILNIPAREGVIGNGWCPYRIEYNAGPSALQSVVVNSLNGFGLDLFLGQSQVIDNLRHSTVLFLQNAEGTETARVFLLSSQTVESFLSKAVKGWKETGNDTHTNTVLEQIASTDLGNLSHPRLTDILALSCAKDKEKRPVIKIRGEEVQPGIIIASELEVGEKKYTFIPSGFFHELLSNLKPILGLKTRADLHAEEAERLKNT